MEENKLSLLHIIPFDLGYTFFDRLSIDNTNNLEFAEAFISELEIKYREIDESIRVCKTLEIKREKRKIYGYKCKDEQIDNVVCRIEFNQHLYAYVLMGGIGCFVLLDEQCNNSKYLITSYDNDVYNVLNVHNLKRESQKRILKGETDPQNKDKYLDAQRTIMIRFLQCSRVLLTSIAKKHKVKCVRAYSSNENYKNNGFSYVLSVYLLKTGVLTDKKLEILLYGSFSNTSAIPNDKVNKLINEFQPDNKYTCQSGMAEFTFSWSAVSATIEIVPNSIVELYENISLCKLIKQEIYVQSRWFLADNSLDNAMRSFKNKLEGLRRLEGIIEYNEAELENEISANMGTEEKTLLKLIVDTSGVKTLYSSAKRQIYMQRKLKEEHENSVKKRNSLILSLFMAIFTACTLYSEIQEVISSQNQNWGLLIAMLIVAIAAVVINYLNQ